MNLPGEVRYAGFWRRVAATLIDTLLFTLLTLPPLYWIYGAAYFSPEASMVMFAGWFDLFVNLVLPLIVVVLLWVRLGATPGKMLLNCRVVDQASGRLPGTGQALLRYFAYLVSALPFMLGFLWVGWDRRKQGFHDKIAGTVVLHRPADEADKSLEELIAEAERGS